MLGVSSRARDLRFAADSLSWCEVIKLQMSSSLGLEQVSALSGFKILHVVGRDDAGVAERFREQLRKTSVHEECLQGGRRGSFL